MEKTYTAIVTGIKTNCRGTIRFTRGGNITYKLNGIYVDKLYLGVRGTCQTPVITRIQKVGRLNIQLQLCGIVELWVYSEESDSVIMYGTLGGVCSCPRDLYSITKSLISPNIQSDIKPSVAQILGNNSANCQGDNTICHGDTDNTEENLEEEQRTEEPPSISVPPLFATVQSSAEGESTMGEVNSNSITVESLMAEDNETESVIEAVADDMVSSVENDLSDNLIFEEDSREDYVEVTGQADSFDGDYTVGGGVSAVHDTSEAFASIRATVQEILAAGEPVENLNAIFPYSRFAIMKRTAEITIAVGELVVDGMTLIAYGIQGVESEPPSESEYFQFVDGWWLVFNK